MIQRPVLTLAVLATAGAILFPGIARASGSDIVLYASDVTTLRGHWSTTSSSGTAGSRKLTSTQNGWSQTERPLSSPANYFEAKFDAPAGTSYRIWLRLRASDNSKWNDSVWVQFSDSTLTSGGAIYRIGSSSGLLVNLERCNSCGTSGWGWFNSAYWLQQANTIRFANTGTHKIRVQTREDGVEIDQIVLSPDRFMSSAPGSVVNDNTIVSKSGGDNTETSSGSRTPYGGSARALPGVVLARDFDEGGEGVAYHDTSSGNTGGAYRRTDVDLQDSSLGGHNVGWMTAGEWLKYTVNVSTSGNYRLSVRVASPDSGNTVKLALDRSGVSQTLSVPRTGDWQSWRDVDFTASLKAGTQTLTLSFPQGGVNVHRVAAASTTASPSSPPAGDPDDRDDPPPPSDSPSGKGGTFRMMTWNIKHGQNKSGNYDPVGQAKFIASQNPQVVVLQEVQTWDENQPQRYKTLLEQLTGVSWHLQWAPVNSKSGTEGNVVLTRLPVVSSSYHQMHATGDWDALYSNRSVARTTVSVGGVQVHLFSTHLDYYNQSHRTAQLQDLMAWAEKFGPRRIVGGDFNSWWGEYWITTMMSDYYDTWQDVTGSNQNGHTVNNAVRFDYLFRSKDGSDHVTPLKVWVPATNLSDHYPVIADFRVTP